MIALMLIVAFVYKLRAANARLHHKPLVDVPLPCNNDTTGGLWWLNTDRDFQILVPLYMY